MTPLAFLSLLALAIAATTPTLPRDAEKVLVFSHETHQPLIDQLYGELIRTPQSDKHKLELLDAGHVTPYVDNAPEPDFVDISGSPATYNQLEKSHQHHQKKLREAAHNGYLSMRGKANFPQDDYTGDLSYGLNILGGIVTFGGFDTMDCFASYEKPIDIAIVGAPFDTGTSYRPGARFGPEAIRLGARRLREGATPVRGNGWNTKLGRVNPYNRKSHNLTIIDCGDVPMTPFDNRVALNQLYRGQRAIHNHTTTGNADIPHPKVITMGGDHTVTLMGLRAAYEKYGQLAVLHFDSHIDTWDPTVLGGGITDYMSLNHGTFLHYAHENGYLAPAKNFHVGLRAPYIQPDYDRQHDIDCGFHTITARDLDRMGQQQIVEKIKNTVGDLPVYISVDIDVLDPANAPGTGTMEIGGWTGRELLSVLDGLEGLNLVGGDVVEVSPPYDSNSEITSLAATAVIDSLLGLMIVRAI